MTPVVTAHGGYRKMLSFGFTCLVYHATVEFCKRNYTFKNDPLGKTAGQMLGAARSARQNIVEGSSRAGTSKETELRLLDVAKGSLQELAGDFEAFLVSRGEEAWTEQDSKTIQLRDLVFEPFTATQDCRHAYCRHILAMRKRFAFALENEDPIHAANAILIAIDRASALLHKQMEKIGEEFRANGGFRERLYKVRQEARDEPEEDAPVCPKCGGAMRKVTARQGPNAGSMFWGCKAYPTCTGTRPLVGKEGC